MVGVCLVDFSVLGFSSDFLDLGTLWGVFLELHRRLQDGCIVAFRNTIRMTVMIMMLDLESLVASFLLSAGSATPFHDLDPLPANRRLSSIKETTNANTFVFTSDHLDIVLTVSSATLLVQYLEVLVLAIRLNTATCHRHGPQNCIRWANHPIEVIDRFGHKPTWINRRGRERQDSVRAARSACSIGQGMDGS
jgi:hypothetical protein